MTTASGRLLAAEGSIGAGGVFSGTYRLERRVDQYGQTAAVGVFAGSLTSADGAHLGMGSRRHTAAAEISSTPEAFRVDTSARSPSSFSGSTSPSRSAPSPSPATCPP